MVVASCGFMAAVLAVTLALVLVYNGQYKNLLYNVTTASEFNQDFKENIDLKMYYYVIESRYSEGLPIQEVQAAQALPRDGLRIWRKRFTRLSRRKVMTAGRCSWKTTSTSSPP